jgi:hypothetical protein
MHTDEFTQKYRITLDTFNNLLEYLRPYITVDPIKSQNSTPGSLPIYPELVVAIGIRWLAGGSYHDIKDFCRVSRSSFYRVRNLFMDACLQAPEIQIQFRSTDAELNEAAESFKARSTHFFFLKCVGALDGLLVKIIQPGNVENPRDYFSGHYQSMGVNVQAMCDSNCSFIYLAIGGPGKLYQRLFTTNLASFWLTHSFLTSLWLRLLVKQLLLHLLLQVAMRTRTRIRML